MAKRKREFKPRKGPDAPRSQIAQLIRDMVESGELRAGESPPSERLLSQQHNIHRDTIHRAFMDLEAEGVVCKVHRGWKVTARKEPLPALSILSNTVMLVTPWELVYSSQHRKGGWSDNIAFGVVEELQAEGSDVFFASREKFFNLPLEQLADTGVNGIVITEIDSCFEKMKSALQRCRQSGVAMVLYGNHPDFQHFNRVYSDHAAGAEMVLHWLADKGCRNVLTLKSQVDYYWAKDRYRGYCEAVEKYNLNHVEPIEVPGFPMDSAGMEDIAGYLERESRHFLGYLADRLTGQHKVDAIMSDSDGHLFAIAKACQLIGIDPQKDIYLCGYDNYWQECPEQSIFPFTPHVTVDKFNERIGREMVRILRAPQVGAADKPQVLKLRPELIVNC